ncbi:WXG100 family type VII secretion target [Streptomyces sp. NPDC054786]
MTYNVTPGELHRAAANATATAADIDQKLQNLRSFCVGLESVWHGIAQQQFEVLMQEYHQLSQMLNRSLDGIAKGLHGTYLNYVDSEQQNISNLRALGDDLPTPTTGTNFR